MKVKKQKYGSIQEQRRAIRRSYRGLMEAFYSLNEAREDRVSRIARWYKALSEDANNDKDAISKEDAKEIANYIEDNKEYFTKGGHDATLVIMPFGVANPDDKSYVINTFTRVLDDCLSGALKLRKKNALIRKRYKLQPWQSFPGESTGNFNIVAVGLPGGSKSSTTSSWCEAHNIKLVKFNAQMEEIQNAITGLTTLSKDENGNIITAIAPSDALEPIEVNIDSSTGHKTPIRVIDTSSYVFKKRKDDMGRDLPDVIDVKGTLANVIDPNVEYLDPREVEDRRVYLGSVLYLDEFNRQVEMSKRQALTGLINDKVIYKHDYRNTLLFTISTINPAVPSDPGAASLSQMEIQRFARSIDFNSNVKDAYAYFRWHAEQELKGELDLRRPDVVDSVLSTLRQYNLAISILSAAPNVSRVDPDTAKAYLGKLFFTGDPDSVSPEQAVDPSVFHFTQVSEISSYDNRDIVVDNPLASVAGGDEKSHSLETYNQVSQRDLTTLIENSDGYIEKFLDIVSHDRNILDFTRKMYQTILSKAVQPTTKQLLSLMAELADEDTDKYDDIADVVDRIGRQEIKGTPTPSHPSRSGGNNNGKGGKGGDDGKGGGGGAAPSPVEPGPDDPNDPQSGGGAMAVPRDDEDEPEAGKPARPDPDSKEFFKGSDGGKGASPKPEPEPDYFDDILNFGDSESESGQVKGGAGEDDDEFPDIDDYF